MYKLTVNKIWRLPQTVNGILIILQHLCLQLWPLHWASHACQTKDVCNSGLQKTLDNSLNYYLNWWQISSRINISGVTYKFMIWVNIVFVKYLINLLIKSLPGVCDQRHKYKIKNWRFWILIFVKGKKSLHIHGLMTNQLSFTLDLNGFINGKFYCWPVIHVKDTNRLNTDFTFYSR